VAELCFIRLMRALACFISLLLWFTDAFAVTPEDGQTTDAEVRRQVLATDDRRLEALRRADVASLRQIYADDYTLVTPAGVIQTKTDQITDLTSGRLQYKKLDVIERTLRVYDDVVVIVSREKTEIMRGGQQVGGDIRVTRIYKRFGPEWRVIATHASRIGQ
jgi:ketosteroid isomerase-like protein